MIKIDGKSLNIDQFIKVARGYDPVELAGDAREKVDHCRKVVENLVDSGEAVYGVTTGFGALESVHISKEDAEELQRRIVRSHSISVGQPLPEDVVRGAMLLRANTLSSGYTGVRVVVVQTIIEMLNKNVVPVIYRKGSLGASGDLSPLAHMASVVIGEGEAYYNGEKMDGGEAMKQAGIKPIKLSFKEGLALINGSQVLTSIGALCWHDSIKLLKYAQIALSLTLEGLGSIQCPFQERVHELRPYVGQAVIAKNVRSLLADSEIMALKVCGKVQDAYSLRCSPQVLGPVLDTLAHCRKQFEVEMNSVVDNPIIFPEDKDAVGAGNFHAEGMAFVLDFMSIVMAEVGNLAERHINRMVNPALSSGLPGFLVKGEGLNSGMMIAQYTAAALVSENKTYAHPASVDSIPVSADQEDHVSMGANAANKLLEIINNVFNIISIDLMCAAQAVEFRRPLKSGKGTQAAFEKIREIVPFWDKDRALYKDVHRLENFIRGDELIQAVEKVVGELEIVK